VKFRKKPIIVNAVQYAGDKAEIKAFVGYKCEDTITEFGIRTLEGFMIVSVLDWVIEGVQGEFCPCKPDIFKQTYEPME